MPVHNPTPDQYVAGSVKQDPVTMAVAVRTIIPDEEYLMDWGVMSVDRGARFAPYIDVAAWPDLTTATSRQD